MRRVRVSLMVVGAIACLAGATSVAAVDARLKVPGGMCSLWTVKQVSSAMKETMKVVRDDPDYCVWYGKKDHNGNISTASAGLWGGDPSSDEPFIDQSREGPRWVGDPGGRRTSPQVEGGTQRQEPRHEHGCLP